MDHTEIVFTPTGVLRRRVSEEAVTEEAADLIFNQIARDITVFTPNLIDEGEWFSALHGISNQNGSSWFAAKIRKLKFNGSWVAEATRLFPGKDGLVTFADASELAVEVPVPLFVFIAPQEKHLFLLTFKVTELADGTLRKTWARLPFPNCYNDGALCAGELPVYDQRLSITTNALRMLEAWGDNPWNQDLYSPDTQSFLAKVASFILPEGEPIPADEGDWNRYASSVNPGVEAINSAFEPLFALYGTKAGKEAGDGPRA